MKKSIRITGFMIILLLGILLTVNSQSTPKEHAEKFFKDYTEQGASIALDNLYSTNEWMTGKTDAITNLKNQLEGLDQDFVGDYYGYELITQKNLTSSYSLLSYLVKFDRQPIRFTFHFYKPDDKWKVHSFQFDGDIDAELDEASRIYLLDFWE